MQILVIFLILGTLFVLFSAFTEDYYFNRKINIIKKSFNILSQQKISDISAESKIIMSLEEQKLKFIICDEKFNPVYFTKNKKDKSNISAKIQRRIIDKQDKFEEGKINTKNGFSKIVGRGILSQNGHKYYLYIYELKTNMQIHLSYYKLFFGIIVIVTAIVGVIVSIITSNMICGPIKQIERHTREAVNNNYNVNISEEQEFKELSGLAESINKMMSKIREQIDSLEKEIQRKTHTENLRRQFVNNVSHEMKTPLAIISNQVEMLELLNDENKKKEYCQSIIEEIESMSGMLNDMIMVYSIQSDEKNLKVVNSDINELLQLSVRDYDKLFDANHITVHEEYPKQCFACVNETFFTQAVSNYLTNAIKHCKNNGNIYVRLMSYDDYIRVEVENDGNQIDETYKDSIWNMFYQGNESYTLNGQKGSGLGLYLVKSIVQLHGGRYGFYNTDTGVAFYFEMPKEQNKI